MIPKDKERDIVAFYQQGLSVPELSDLYGISDKSIYYIFKKNSIILRRRSGVGKILSQAQEEDIIALYQQGIDAVQLASRYKISSTTVYDMLERNDIKRRTNSDIWGSSMNGPGNHAKPPTAFIRTAFSLRKYKRSNNMRDYPSLRFMASRYQLA
jgi:Mor family transcriptional regulator